MSVLAGQVRIPGLEAVLHYYGNFTVLSAEQVLKLSCVDGIRLIRRCLELKFLLMKNTIRLCQARQLRL